MKEFLAIAESLGCRIINNSTTFKLELSKVYQYITLQNLGIRTPKTIAVVGMEKIEKLKNNKFKILNRLGQKPTIRGCRVDWIPVNN